ncbi:hypothetical protein GCM10011490_11440 [Pseudoclavibacter endophyticus]|uniref:Uncharacterized protein n=1 Tax=Pseudoclavibacter endophyticus TaxID=1778590 RepID=A0A6H9WNY8_9MICO|nr:hypothetical protein [Pseudoclavibacter endophyticus]KAB1649431.1 hypothetical protein F8O04_03970 [Pseudoclavibacter endophyticus]GGA62710.1 hypothetical protein GCM10011490_11440 [Pseudoclavibacter endophyticus]
MSDEHAEREAGGASPSRRDRRARERRVGTRAAQRAERSASAAELAAEALALADAAVGAGEESGQSSGGEGVSVDVDASPPDLDAIPPDFDSTSPDVDAEPAGIEGVSPREVAPDDGGNVRDRSSGAAEARLDPDASGRIVTAPVGAAAVSAATQMLLPLADDVGVASDETEVGPSRRPPIDGATVAGGPEAVPARRSRPVSTRARVPVALAQRRRLRTAWLSSAAGVGMLAMAGYVWLLSLPPTGADDGRPAVGVTISSTSPAGEQGVPLSGTHAPASDDAASTGGAASDGGGPDADVPQTPVDDASSGGDPVEDAGADATQSSGDDVGAPAPSTGGAVEPAEETTPTASGRPTVTDSPMPSTEPGLSVPPTCEIAGGATTPVPTADGVDCPAP